MKRKPQLRAEASIRAEQHNRLTPQEKLAKAKLNRGSSRKEIARLTATIVATVDP